MAGGAPILYAVFVWWFLTGLIVYLDGLPRRTFVWSLFCATLALGLGLYGLSATRGDETAAGAYCAFTSALLVWGWHEMSFLMGLVTGPRATALPKGCAGFRRVVLATQTILYHEIALALTALLIFALTQGGANQIGLWTFLILWSMRLSAKLNVFLGVPNLAQSFLPEHLKFLETYFRKKPMNWLFPVSVTGSALATQALAQPIFADHASEFTMVGNTFLATLMGLAMIEHWFMVLPFEATALWAWGLKSHAVQAAEAAEPTPTTVEGASRGVLLPRPTGAGW